MYFQYSFIGLQLLAFFIAFFRLKKHKSEFMYLLTALLLLTFLNESIGLYHVSAKKTGGQIYHLIYTFFQFNIIALMYFKLIKDKISQKVILFLTVLFSVSFGVVFFKNLSFIYLIIFGALNTSLYVFLYLRELLLSNEVLNYKRMLPFWVSVGFIAFYLPSIPFFSLIKHMKDRGLFFILYVLIALMNLFIIYGLICSKKRI